MGVQLVQLNPVHTGNVAITNTLENILFTKCNIFVLIIKTMIVDSKYGVIDCQNVFTGEIKDVVFGEPTCSFV